MKENKLLSLQRLVRRQSPHEKETLRRFLTVFDSRNDVHPKTLILLDLLEVHEDAFQLEKAVAEAFAEESKDAVRMIAYRLKEKLEECLLLDVNLNRKGAYEDPLKAQVEVAKKFEVAAIYRVRGLRAEALALYEKIIKQAKKYELYSPLVEVLHLKQGLLGLVYGPEKFYPMEPEVKFYQKCLDAATKAKQDYIAITGNYSHKGLNRNSTGEAFKDALEQSIERLKKDFATTSSATVGFYYYMIQIEHFQVLKRYGKASEYCAHVIEIVRNNPSIFLKRRLGMAYLNYSQNEIFNHYFDFAIGFAEEAYALFAPYSRNHNLALELKFYAQFYAGQLDEAQSTINELVLSPERKHSEFRLAWRHYLMACLAFVKGNLAEVNSLLNETKKINKDKVGWNLGVRCLSILTSIEQENFDGADSQILSLQQFMKQALKGSVIRKREELILKVFLSLRREGYQFEVVAEKCSNQLEMLGREQDDDCSWQTQSPEMIVFHKWFETRVRNESYVLNYSRQHIYSKAL